jgi:zinc/manganese transport system permease protein
MPLIELFYPVVLLVVMLVFIHALFGIEIIQRGVIFTDLAIGQMAAVGMALSIGFFEGAYQTLFTLLFALITALLLTYMSKERVVHIEAFIGMLYALGVSSIMILLANSPQGAELFNKLSATDILFTTVEDLLIPALLYSVIAGVMWFIYPKLKGLARESLFFILLALVVTSSVQIAGVFVVFVLLVAPSLFALSFTEKRVLRWAWLEGVSVSLIALSIAYFFDLPTGYTLIMVHSLVVVLWLLLHKCNHN